MRTRFKHWVIRVLHAKPSMYSSSLVANVLGMQFLRRGVFWLHRRARMPHATPAAYRPLLDALVREGVAFVPNFLPPETYALVKREYDRLSGGFVADASAVPVPKVTGMSLHDPRLDPRARDAFTTNPLFPAIAQAFLNRPYHFPMQGFLTRIACDEDELTLPKNGGTNNVHFDAPMRVLKFFYLVNDVTEANGPLTYCKGSNRRSLRQLWLEYKLSIRYAKNRHNPAHGGEYRDDEPWVKVTAEDMRRAGLVETPITGKANTLIIADVGGFHRRGTFRTPGERNTVEINYRSIECLRNDLYPLELRLRRLLGKPLRPAALVPATEAQ